METINQFDSWTRQERCKRGTGCQEATPEGAALPKQKTKKQKQK
jgi:hypothetical protein